MKKILKSIVMAALVVAAFAAVASAATWVEVAKPFDVGEGTESLPYKIMTPEQLAFLAKAVNAGSTDYTSAYYSVEADIDLTGNEWVPIGLGKTDNSQSYFTSAADGNKSFKGTFDGKGHTIKGMTITNPAVEKGTASGFNAVAGLFGAVNGGVVKNVNVVANINVAAGDEQPYFLTVGGVAAILNGDGTGKKGVVENCHVFGTIQGNTAVRPHIAGVVGANEKGLITGCTNSAAVTGGEGDEISGQGNTARSITGGIVAAVWDGSVKDSINTGAITGKDAQSDNSATGGIVAYAFASASGDVTVSGCSNLGEIVGGATANVGGDAFMRSSTGGVVAWIAQEQGATGTILVEKSSNSGAVVGGSADASASNTGGIVGTADLTNANNAIKFCSNVGDVTGGAKGNPINVGGLVGNFRDSNGSKISNGYSTHAESSMNVNDPAAKVGGIVGDAVADDLDKTYYLNDGSGPLFGIGTASADVDGKVVSTDVLTGLIGTDKLDTAAWVYPAGNNSRPFLANFLEAGQPKVKVVTENMMNFKQSVAETKTGVLFVGDLPVVVTGGTSSLGGMSVSKNNPFTVTHEADSQAGEGLMTLAYTVDGWSNLPAAAFEFSVLKDGVPIAEGNGATIEVITASLPDGLRAIDPEEFVKWAMVEKKDVPTKAIYSGVALTPSATISLDLALVSGDAVAMEYSLNTANMSEQSIPEALKNWAAKSDDAKIAALDNGFEMIYEYEKHSGGLQYSKLIGRDALISWADAVAAGIVSIEGSNIDVRYAVTDGDAKPYFDKTTKFLIVPDGAADDALIDPIWLMQRRGWSDGDSGCDTGVGLLALAGAAAVTFLSRKR